MKLDNRLWILVASLLTAALLAGGFFIGVQPQLQVASDLGLERDAARAQNQATRAELAVLAKQQEELPALAEQLSALQTSIPAGIGGSAFVAELNTIASETGVTLTNATISEPTTYAPAESEAPAGEGEGAADEAAEPAEADPAAPLVDSRITTSNFVVVPIAIEATGSNEAVLAFVDRVQAGSRLALVQRVQKTRSEDEETAGQFTVKLGGSIYAVTSSPTALIAAAQAEADAAAAAQDADGAEG